MSKLNYSLFLLIFICCFIKQGESAKKIVNVPLDQRFTTRYAFLNLAKITPYQISTLPDPLLPSLKKYSPPSQIINWAFKQSDGSQFGILSLQSLLYGSLIASRISNDTEEAITTRLNQIVSFIKSKPQWKLYCSAVIMRIPHYNGDFEQPWYWGQYGQSLYTYSFYCDKYNQTKQSDDLKTCEQASKQIPINIVHQFQWRRARNHNITLKLLNMMSNQKNLFKRLYITLDDSAQYGYNAQQAKQIISKINLYNLSNVIRVYPGADQVSLALLSSLAVDDSVEPIPIISMIFRNISTINYIPKYEGLPMIQTLQNQIKAAGAIPINGSIADRGNITFLVNNFDQSSQMQAPSQGPINEKKYSIFDNYICFPNKTQIIGFADNRYCNGADVYFVNYALSKAKGCRNITQWAYAGWNTNGNTLGTVAANTILLWVFRNYRLESNIEKEITDVRVSPCPQGNLKCANSYFNMLRILQDKDWQVILRQMTRNYIYQTPGDNINNLTNDLSFYQNFAYKSMAAKLTQLKSIFELQFSLAGVYYPWNRTFEIGLYGAMDKNKTLYIQKQIE